MADSPLFNKFINNVQPKLFGQRNFDAPYYVANSEVGNVEEQQAILKHYEEGGGPPSGPSPDNVHYEELQQRDRFNKWFNLDSVSKIESNNIADAESEAGALGFYQIKPDVARDPGYGIKPLVTPDGTYTREDILASSKERQEDFVYSYLSQAKAIFKDDKAKTILSYLEGIPTTKNIAAGKKKISPQGIGYLEKYMLNGDLKKHEILKSFPQLKTHPKFGNMIREDGTKKSSTGWLGPIKHNNGQTMTELSTYFEDVLDGREIPLLVPTLTKTEIEILKSRDMKTGALPRSIINKAIRHAIERDAQGLSPFYEE